MTLSIVIPTHRRAALVQRLLQSIERQTQVENLEVLVVSNFKDPQLEKSLIPFQSTLAPKLLVASRPGANASRNLGMDQAQGSILLFLDDDCSLHKTNYLRRLLQAHRDFPNTQVIGGSYESEARATLEQRAYNLISTTWCESHQFIQEESWALLGGNVSYKCCVRDSSLRFNEDILYGGSETEFHARLYAQGMRMKYLPHLGLLHRPQVTSRKIFEKALKQAHTATHFQIPYKHRAAHLGKYLYTQKISQISRTEAQFQKYLEVFRLHEDAFLNTSQYKSVWNRSKRLFDFHRKSLLC